MFGRKSDGWRARRAILHIGAPKCGTTAVQTALAASRRDLAGQGALYPTSLGQTSHQPLAAALLGRRATASLQAFFGVAGWRGRRILLENLTAALRREVDENRPETLVLSSEHFFAASGSSEIRRLARFLASFARRVEVLVYLRRQDAALWSAWRHGARVGNAEAFAPPARIRRGDRYDYAARLADWRAVFGDGSVRALPFEWTRLAEGDAVADFALRAGVTLAKGGGENASLDDARAAFMRGMAAFEPRLRGNSLNPAWGDLDLAIDAAEGTRAARIPVREAKAILDLYDASNARLSREWSGGRPFFDAEISGGDECGDQLDLETAMEISGALWARQQMKINRLNAKLAQFQGASQHPAQPFATSKTARRWPPSARSRASTFSAATSTAQKCASPASWSPGDRINAVESPSSGA